MEAHHIVPAIVVNPDIVTVVTQAQENRLSPHVLRVEHCRVSPDTKFLVDGSFKTYNSRSFIASEIQSVRHSPIIVLHRVRSFCSGHRLDSATTISRSVADVFCDQQ